MLQEPILKIERYLQAEPFLTCSEWVPVNIDLSHDKTASASGPVDLSITPHLGEPLDYWSRDDSQKIDMTVMAIEQTGKSCIWLWGSLYVIDMGIQPTTLMVHKSDDDAIDINTERFKPLMKGIPKLADELSRPKSHGKDCFRFSNHVYHFMGGGSDIVSFPAAVTIADEPESWPKSTEKVLKDFEDLGKRSRSFDGARQVAVCSPRGGKGTIIAVRFFRSSQGHWTLRCQNKKCRKLLIRSCDTHNLQWELDKEKLVRPDTVRLYCPGCKKEHTEDQKLIMNQEGKYIHRKKELLNSHVGYQWGALAGTFQRGIAWPEIAKEQMASGKTANIEKQKNFANSWRGMPYKQRPINEDQLDAILSHCCQTPPANQLENTFLVADTQLDGWFWTLWGVMSNGNFPLLQYGFTEYLELSDEQREKVNEERQTHADMNGDDFTPVVTHDDIWNREYEGILPALGIIDEGGHREKEVTPYVAERLGLYSYKGDNRACTSQKWKFSEEKENLILCREKDYFTDFLYYIYIQKNTDKFYFMLPSEISDELLEHLAAVRKGEGHNGHLFENYTHNGRKHDFFDNGKMFLALIDIAKEILNSDEWRIGHLEGIAKPITATPAVTGTAPGGWMSGAGIN